MQHPNSPAPEAVLRRYFCAKDENRPHLLKDVFAIGAQLVIHNRSANITLPAVTKVTIVARSCGLMVRTTSRAFSTEALPMMDSPTT